MSQCKGQCNVVDLFSMTSVYSAGDVSSQSRGFGGN